MDPVSKAQRGVANNEKTTKRPGGITGKGFFPGKSGNPSGRPKKKPVTEMFEELFGDPTTRESIKKQIKSTLTKRGMAGVLMLREGAERVEGKVTQEVTMNVNALLTLSETIQQRRKRRAGGSSES